MGKSVAFEGHNRRYEVPMEAGDELSIADPMLAQTNGVITAVCWHLSDDELAEVNKTGQVWMVARSGMRPLQPHWIGSLKEVKRSCIDFAGGIWRKWPVKKPDEPA